MVRRAKVGLPPIITGRWGAATEPSAARAGGISARGTWFGGVGAAKPVRLTLSVAWARTIPPHRRRLHRATPVPLTSAIHCRTRRSPGHGSWWRFCPGKPGPTRLIEAMSSEWRSRKHERAKARKGRSNGRKRTQAFPWPACPQRPFGGRAMPLRLCYNPAGPSHATVGKYLTSQRDRATGRRRGKGDS